MSPPSGTRSYARLIPGTLDSLTRPPARTARRVLFVCTANSARSHLAAALWRRASTVPAASAGTHPANAIAAGAIAAAERHHLPLRRLRPGHLDEVQEHGDLIVTICDMAYEELGQLPAIHWALSPTPSQPATPAASTRHWLSCATASNGSHRASQLLPDTPYTTLAASSRTAEPASSTGQILNQTTGVRAPVRAADVARAISSRAAVR